MAEVEPELGIFEYDESYFSGVRKGKRGRGAAGKVCVFGILKRGGSVYALPVADATSQTLLTILKTKTKTDLLVYIDSPSSYNILDISGSRHHRSTTPKPSFLSRETKSTASKTFGTNRVLRKYNGITAQLDAEENDQRQNAV